MKNDEQRNETAFIRCVSAIDRTRGFPFGYRKRSEWERERGRERERRETAVGKGRDSPRPDGATHSEMVPPIIKADLPSLLVLAHGGLANGEAALQPAAFAALQTYPGVGKCPPLTLHILCCYLGSIDKQKFPQTFPFFVFFFPSGFFHSFVDFSFQFFKLFFFSLSRISNTNNNTWLSSKKKTIPRNLFLLFIYFFFSIQLLFECCMVTSSLTGDVKFSVFIKDESNPFFFPEGKKFFPLPIFVSLASSLRGK